MPQIHTMLHAAPSTEGAFWLADMAKSFIHPVPFSGRKQGIRDIAGCLGGCILRLPCMEPCWKCRKPDMLQRQERHGQKAEQRKPQPVLRTAGQSFSKQRFDSKKQHNDNADAQVAGKKTNGKTSHVSFLLFWNFQQAACAANQFPGWRGCHHPDRRLPSPSGCCCKSVPKRNGFPG